MSCKLHNQDDCIACTFLAPTVAGTKKAKAKAKKPARGEPDADGNVATDFKGRLRVCEVMSDSNPDRGYAVCIKDGIWECACPAWTRGSAQWAKARETATGGSVRRVNCKHIDRVLAWFKATEAKTGASSITLKSSLAMAVGRRIKPAAQWTEFVKHAGGDAQDAVLVLLPLLAAEDPLTVAGAWNSIWTVMTMPVP